jgi:hypothetical protein
MSEESAERMKARFSLFMKTSGSQVETAQKHSLLLFMLLRNIVEAYIAFESTHSPEAIKDLMQECEHAADTLREHDLA